MDSDLSASLRNLRRNSFPALEFFPEGFSLTTTETNTEVTNPCLREVSVYRAFLHAVSDACARQLGQEEATEDGAIDNRRSGQDEREGIQPS